MISQGRVSLKLSDYSSKLLETVGELSDYDAKTSLVKFLYNNPAFTFDFLANYKLFDFQEIMLLAWIRKNFSLNIWSRGGSKSYLAAIFCIFYCIFNPGNKIVIISCNFRRTKDILLAMERLLKLPEFGFFKACFSGNLYRRNEIWSWECDNGSSVVALPMAAGGGIRGQRADVMIIDEFLLISEEIYNAVLFPFMIARSGIQDILKIKEMEDKLIKQGIMTEGDRELLTSTKKVIGLSSASFEFEFLYRKFQEWIKMAGLGIEDKTLGTYFVSQLSCDYFPVELIDEKIKREAKETMSDSTYARELGAQFVSDSSGYYRASKMNECTLKDGQMPCIEIIGDKKAEYILAIDTSSSASETSDDFAMNLLKLTPENRSGILVHNYAVAGGDLKEHIKYLHYLLTHFNVVVLIIDGTGGGRAFIEACNESSLFKDSGILLNFWEADFDDDEKRVLNLREAKRIYNLSDKKIVYLQQFNTESIRKMNENLQAKIDRKGIWFASRIGCPLAESEYNRTLLIKLPIIKDDSEMCDFLEEQDRLIQLTKDECSLIEVKSTPLGALTFDLPSSMKKSTAPTRTRRDSYTALLLAAWAMKNWYDIIDFKDEMAAFKPFMI